MYLNDWIITNSYVVHIVGYSIHLTQTCLKGSGCTSSVFVMQMPLTYHPKSRDEPHDKQYLRLDFPPLVHAIEQVLIFQSRVYTGPVTPWPLASR